MFLHTSRRELVGSTIIIGNAGSVPSDHEPVVANKKRKGRDDKQSNTKRANDAPVAAAKSVSNADSRSSLSKAAKTSVVARPGVPRPVARPFLSSKQTNHHAAIESVSD
jgi:hypothetical protein